MRLASESSSLKPVVAESSKPDVRKPPHKSKLLSVSKLRGAGIYLASINQVRLRIIQFYEYIAGNFGLS